MGYAMFACSKIVMTARLNSAQMQQMMASLAQMDLATQSASIQQQKSSMEASQAGELSELYSGLASATDDDARSSINAQIKAKEEAQKQELDSVNQEIYKVSVAENALEMKVKALDTLVTALEKQLEAIEQAEGKGIDRATPKYGGIS